MPNDLPQRFVEFIRRHDLVTAGDIIGIAVSGGVDSITLLHLFEGARAELQIDLTVLHFNHQLRMEAKEEQLFVASLCRSKNIPLIVDGIDVAEFAQKHQLSIETAARETRYAFFETSAKQMHLTKIATGHTASDQAETVLDHILRGSGITGLTGIPLQRNIFIRPLLFAERMDIENFAAEHSLEYKVDASNENEQFKRNKIRHTLLPLLQKEFNPQITRALNRLSSHAREADTIMEDAADKALNLCLRSTEPDKIVLEFKEFLAYFNSLQRLVLRRVFSMLDMNPNLLNFTRFRNIQQFLRTKESGAFQLAENLNLIKSGDLLIISTLAQQHRHIETKTTTGSVFLWNNLFLEIKTSAKPLTLTNQNPTIEIIDADRLGASLTIRSHRDGDFFYPVNGAGRKKVTDYLADEKIPFHQRHDIPLLESSGQIVWICGRRLDDRFKITENTRNFYQIKLVKRER